MQDCKDCWLGTSEIEGIFPKFQRVLFIVLENFTASGYGEIKPQVEVHILVCTILMVIGRLFESYIIGK